MATPEREALLQVGAERSEAQRGSQFTMRRDPTTLGFSRNKSGISPTYQTGVELLL